jgi:hypothetical protein
VIEGLVQIPAVLERLYASEQLPAREIERQLGASHSGVLKALDRFAIAQNGSGRKRTGLLPFGFDFLNHQRAKDEENRADGLSLRAIADALNPSLRPSTAVPGKQTP